MLTQEVFDPPELIGCVISGGTAMAVQIGTNPSCRVNDTVKSHTYGRHFCRNNINLLKDGVVFRSAFPVSRFIEAGADSRVVEETEVIYLGVSCDVRSKVLGAGTWSWANGGFWLNFENQRISFPRQEVSCDEWSVSSVCED